MLIALLVVIAVMFLFLVVMEDKLHKYLAIIHSKNQDIELLLQLNREFIVQIKDKVEDL